MKAKIAVIAMLVSSFSVSATSNDIQKQIDDLKSGLHDVHMNTLQKYSESWGLEDRANIAKLQETKVDKAVFEVDQKRQDKALSDSVVNQKATDAKQTSDLKGYADKKATSAYQTSVAHTDSKVARADADRKAGDDALSSRINDNQAAQSERDAGQDSHISAVQGAAQIANDRASNLEVRADTVEGNVRETNAQVEYNASYAQSRLDAADAHNEANRAALVSTNRKVSQHSAELANHEKRITTLESETNSNFANMDRRINDVSDRADAGVAGVAAMASIPQVLESQTFNIGAGVGSRNSQQALAVGFSARASQSVVVKASVSADTNEGFTFGGGMSIGW